MRKTGLYIKKEEASFTYRAAALIIKGNKLLAAKSADYPCYYTVGGVVEINETSEEAVIREVYLGLIIEAVTGLPFDEYLAREVFTPCGMIHTCYHEYDRLPANCANVYIRDEKGEYYTNIYSSGAK